MKETSPLEKATQAAYRLLLIRSRSVKELRERLLRKGFAEDTVLQAIEKLRRQGYLDDRAFARSQARRLAAKFEGNLRIELELKEHGLDRDEIAAALAEARSDLTEAQAVERLIRRKMKAEFGKDEKRKLVQSLMRKGFPAGLIFEVLDRVRKGDVHGDDG
ncbi:MAG: regulatory protein RecX, partial [Smithellaceae bacterium]|nr:regulatory protein RecX [Smithellaceae bacterium]